MMTSVAVFCGSNTGEDPIYMLHAATLGHLIGSNGLTLVYGGGKAGLMGAVANAALHAGGKVIGVIPVMLKDRERHHTGITELHIVEDMHTRKKMMYELCDAAIILPGGNGTLDEMFEMATWNALTIHHKKIILLNTAGFYTHLINHINHMQQQGFLHSDWRQMVEVYDTPDTIFSAYGQDRS